MEHLTHIRPNMIHRPLRSSPEIISAHEAGLIYVNEDTAGIRRRRKGKGFSYVNIDGSLITDEKILKRIRHLVIPPAYNDVWICQSPRGHIQATGRDARNRKQYKYHEKWQEVRDAHKFHRMIAFDKALLKIREATERDLKRHGLPREKVLAMAVQLLEKTLIRVGNEEYVKSNGSYGLTTLRDKQVVVDGSQIHFEFKGKSKVHHVIDIADRRLAKIISNCQDLPGHELFQYLDEQGNRHLIGSEDVNAYLREITGEEFTAKDFRTWAGTLLAFHSLQEVPIFESLTEAKRNINKVISQVAERLGNTKAICRKCYIHPAVIDIYMEKSIETHSKSGRREDQVFSIIAHWSKKEGSKLKH